MVLGFDNLTKFFRVIQKMFRVIRALSKSFFETDRGVTQHKKSSFPLKISYC